MRPEFDVLIVGGGMVGASLACALVGYGLRIGIVEATVPAFEGESAKGQPSYDDRAIALAYGSRRIFSALGVWPGLAAEAAPIRHIHISDRGHFGVARLDAQEEGVEALGYVVLARALGKALTARLEVSNEIEWFCPARVSTVQPLHDSVEVTIQLAEGEERLGARLLVASDGGNSIVREQLALPVTRWDYGQIAIIANVTPEFPHAQVAYERFTESGPVAFLPMPDERCSVVWIAPRQAKDDILALSERRFLAVLQERFGFRLGRLQRAGKRQAYALGLVRARKTILPRVALVGNAAHTLHPVAGQGFNLGLRDVAVLAEVLTEAARAGEDPGDLRVLQRYADGRRRDQRTVVAFTDLLARLFSNPLSSIALGRNLGLLAVDIFPALKHRLARQTMGLTGRLPRLARGLPP